MLMHFAKLKTLVWISNREIRPRYSINDIRNVYDYCRDTLRDTLMNERIKELMSRARSLGNDEVSQLERVHNRTYTFDEVDAIHYQKFAELIIAETLNKVTDTMELTWPNMEVKIKQHFGVEDRA